MCRNFNACLILVSLISTYFDKTTATQCFVKVNITKYDDPEFYKITADQFSQKCKLTQERGRVFKCRNVNDKFVRRKCMCNIAQYYDDNLWTCMKGELKQMSVEECENNSASGNAPCQNEGTLIKFGQLADLAKCSCREGYRGTYCQRLVGNVECLVVPETDNTSQECDTDILRTNICWRMYKTSGDKSIKVKCDHTRIVQDDKVQDCKHVVATVTLPTPKPDYNIGGISGTSGMHQYDVFQDCYEKVNIAKYDFPEFYNISQEEYIEVCDDYSDDLGKLGKLYQCKERGDNVTVSRKCICNIAQYKDKRLWSCFEPHEDNEDRELSQLSATDCENYSKSGDGPCQNGGKIIKHFNYILARHLKCSCPEGFAGDFCERLVGYVKCDIPSETETAIEECGEILRNNKCKRQYSTVGKENITVICDHSQTVKDIEEFQKCKNVVGRVSIQKDKIKSDKLGEVSAGGIKRQNASIQVLCTVLALLVVQWETS